MAAKKKPARKPPRFEYDKSFAECRSSPSGRTVLVDFWTHLSPRRTIRFAAWMAKAAAWCSETPRKKARKR